MLYFYLNTIILILLFENFRRRIKYIIPFGELIAIAFCIENSFAPSILYAFYSPQYYVQGDSYFIDYPIEKFLLFSTISSAIFAFSLRSRNKNNIHQQFHKQQKYQLNPFQIIFIYSIGFIIQVFQFGELLFISSITYFIVAISLLTYEHNTKTLSYLIRFLGLTYLFVESTKSGMFGSLISGSIILLLYTTFQISSKQIKSPNVLVFYTLIIIGFITLAFSQHFKQSTRAEIWEGQNTTTNEIKIENIFTNYSIIDGEFYRPAASRLNQGWLVSLVMKKSETNNTILLGKTLIDAIFTAVIPRIIWTDKPKAGGHENIKNYTDLKLVGSTSMNIGTLGELFVNFGFFAPIALFFYGSFIRLTIKNLQSKVNPSKKLYFYLVPFVFLGFLASGNDIAMQLTTYFKSFFFIYILNKVLS
jgi:hypothetical protein